jgi:hypothetical protein
MEAKQIEEINNLLCARRLQIIFEDILNPQLRIIEEDLQDGVARLDNIIDRLTEGNDDRSGSFSESF